MERGPSTRGCQALHADARAGSPGAGWSGMKGAVQPVRLTDRLAAELGSPYWCQRTGVLRFVDRLGGDVLTYDRSGGVQRRTSGSTRAAVVRPRADGGVLVVTDRELAIASRDDLADLQPWGSLLADARQYFVDGGCSPTGKLYLGTASYGPPGIAMVYRIDAGEAAGQPVVAGLARVGGIDWSPDHRTCYVQDDLTTWAFTYLPHHGIIDQREVLTSPFGPARDLRVDALGGLWSCHPETDLVIRRSPDGEVTHAIELPAPSACAFGGPLLTTLYCCADGALWSVQPGVAGLPTRPFRGEPPRHFT